MQKEYKDRSRRMKKLKVKSTKNLDDIFVFSFEKSTNMHAQICNLAKRLGVNSEEFDFLMNHANQEFVHVQDKEVTLEVLIDNFVFFIVRTSMDQSALYAILEEYFEF